MGAEVLIAALGPSLIELAAKIYAALASSPETPEAKKAHYATIAASLEVTNYLVQQTPLPPPGSGA